MNGNPARPLSRTLIRLSLSLLLLPAAAVAARAAHYVINPGSPNLVKFDSKSTAESFSGSTRTVRGAIDFNPQNLADSAAVNVEVDLNTLDTGISLRNQQMRESHLETDKYPKAFFRGGKMSGFSAAALTPGQKATFNLAGEFEIHGVKRPLVLPVEVTEGNQDGKDFVHIVGHFPVTLADYNISRPQFLVLRLGETQQVTIDLTAVESPETPPAGSGH